MKNKYLALMLTVAAALPWLIVACQAGGVNAVKLGDLTPVSEIYHAYHVIQLGEHRSIGPVTVGGRVFREGIGVEINSSLIYALNGDYRQLDIKAGLSPAGKEFYSDKKVRFEIRGDGKLLFSSQVSKLNEGLGPIRVPLDGVQKLALRTRGPLVSGSDPRAAVWAGGRLLKAARPSGRESVYTKSVQTYDGPELTISRFGENGLIIEEYNSLVQFIKSTAYPMGSELMIIRNTPYTAIDIKGDLAAAGGLGADAGMASWDTRQRPPRLRIYRVSKMSHSILRKAPVVDKFEKTIAEPSVTAADKKKLKKFLGSMGAWAGGDLLVILKEGKDAALGDDTAKDGRLEMMKDFKPEEYKQYLAAKPLNLAPEFNALIKGKAAVDVSRENCGAKLCTAYVIQIPARMTGKLPRSLELLRYLVFGASALELPGAVMLGVLIFRRKRRLLKYYLAVSLPVAALWLYGVYKITHAIAWRDILPIGFIHTPVLLVFALIYFSQPTEYQPAKTNFFRGVQRVSKWLFLTGAAASLLFLTLSPGYEKLREPKVVETKIEGDLRINFVRINTLITAMDGLLGRTDNRWGWTEKKNNQVGCYVLLSVIENEGGRVSRNWNTIKLRKDFESKVLWGLLKDVPAAERKNYFTAGEIKAVTAHEKAHGEDYLNSLYGDGPGGGRAESVKRETKAYLAGLQISPYALVLLNRFTGENAAAGARKEIFKNFMEYADTPALGDIAELSPREISRRAEEISQRIVIGAGFDYWEGKAAKAPLIADKIRYYKWAIAAWSPEKDGLPKDAAALKNLADLLWKTGQYGPAITCYAGLPGLGSNAYCDTLVTNKPIWAYLKTPKAKTEEKNVYAKAVADCAGHYKFGKDDPDKAFRYFRAAAQLSPGSWEVSREWSGAYKALKKDADAVAVLNKFIKAAPKDYRGYLARARLYGEKGESAKEIKDLDQALKLDPKNESARMLRGMAYYDKGDVRKALEVFPGGREKLAGRYYSVAQVSYSSRKYEKAVEAYTKAIRLDPKYTEAYFWRGAAHNELKQYDKALSDLNVTVKLDPKHSGAYNSFGFAYAFLRQYDKARGSFSKAIELDRGSYWPYSNRGWVNLVLNKCDEARADIEKAMVLDPKHSAGYANLGSYYWSCRKDKGKALEEYEKAFKNGFSKFDTLFDEKDDGQLLKGLNDTNEFKDLVEKYRKSRE